MEKGTCQAEPFAALEGKLRDARRGGLFLVENKQSRFLSRPGAQSSGARCACGIGMTPLGFFDSLLN
jgi:hypothetical protein